MKPGESVHGKREARLRGSAGVLFFRYRILRLLVRSSGVERNQGFVRARAALDHALPKCFQGLKSTGTGTRVGQQREQIKSCLLFWITYGNLHTAERGRVQ